VGFIGSVQIAHLISVTMTQYYGSMRDASYEYVVDGNPAG
jgi:hypothetical protein